MTAPTWAVGFALVVLVAVAAGAPLVDRDEPRYAQAVREMRQTGDLLVPRNFGQLRPDKPILMYWLQLVTTAVVGESELGFRLPSLVALAAWVWLAALLVRELAGERGWALLPGMALAGVLATPDALVGALTTGCLWAFLRAANGGGNGAAAGAWVLFGLGILAKGPVTPLFVIPALLGYCGKDRRLWRAVVPWWGPVLACGLVAAWFLPANLVTGWELARLGLGKHVLQRALVPLESHGVSGPLGVLLGPPFYAASFALAAFPMAGGLVRFCRTGREHDPRLWRTVVWGILGPLVVLSLAATKLPHYILPAVPLVLAASKPRGKEKALAAAASGVLALALGVLAHQAPYRQAARFIRTVGGLTCAFAPQEGSLRFYAGDKLAIVQGSEKRCRFFLLRPGEEQRLGVLLGPETEPLRAFSGWNLAKGRREILRLYQLNMGRRE